MDLCGEEVTDKGLLKLHKQTRGKKKKNQNRILKNRSNHIELPGETPV